jgi:hypothetical protein
MTEHEKIDVLTEGMKKLETGTRAYFGNLIDTLADLHRKRPVPVTGTAVRKRPKKNTKKNQNT